MNIVRRKIELSCPAEKIPNELIVDLKGSDIGTSLKISSVNLDENVKPTIVGRDFVIATVAPPTVIKEPEKPAEEAAEGATADGEAVAAEGADSKAAQAKDGKETDTKKDEKSKDGATDKKSQSSEKKPQEKK